MALHNSGDVRAGNVDVCLFFDDFLDLTSLVYSCFLELLDCIRSNLELALSEALFLPQVFDKRRFLFYLADQLADKPGCDSKPSSCLFVA